MKKVAFLYGALAMASLFYVEPAAAQDANDQDVKALLKALKAQSQRLAKQEKRLADQEAALEQQRRTLAQEEKEFESLQSKVAAATGEKVASTPPAPQPGWTQPKPPQPALAANEEVGTEKKASKEKPPEIPAVIEEGGVLAGKGKLVVTPALEYSHSSATSVEILGFSIVPALNVGAFDIAQVKRDMLTPSLDLRYGITNRFEIEGKVPYVWRRDSTLGRPIGVGNSTDTLTNVTGSNIGDIELAAHYQMTSGQGNWPYLVGNLRFKTATGTSPFDVPIVNGLETKLPTGSGEYAIQPSLTAIVPSDPVVYYGNVGYLYNFARNFPGYGRVRLGDGISASMGMSLALNDKSSFSLGYSHTIVLRTSENNQYVQHTGPLQVGTLDLGYSYNLTPNTNLNFTVSAGLTSDAPDVRLILRVPMTFDFGK